MAQVIAIIGGGPCGLTLARLLELKGIDYVVYERDESENSNRPGGTLDLHPDSGQCALREAGLFDEFKRFARYDDTALTVADKLGKKYLEIGEGRDAPEIDRVQLRQILLDSVPKDKIKWGHGLTSATLGEDNKPVLHFSNGVVLSGFKLVVGADGAWSKVRPMLTQGKPLYSGKCYIESKISLANPFYERMAKTAGPGGSTSIGSGMQIVSQRQSDRSYRIYFAVQVPEDFFRNGTVDLQDTEATRNLLLSSEFYADWSDHYRDLIKHVTDFRSWSLYSLPIESLNWKPAPGLTLVGDAAHLSLPNGEGVNCAMTDAMKLASKIAEYGTENLDKAVREYEMDMFPRGIETITTGHQMAAVMFSEDPKAFLQLMNSWMTSD